VIDGNEQAADGKLKLGRPWHNSPKAVYINTLVKIPLAPEGWTNMGTIPALFAEYNSMDMNGKALDLSCRKTEYETGGKEKRKGECRATITSNEAALYTYENIIKSKDGWDPRSMMEQLPAPAHIRWEQDGLKWDAVPGALGYVLDVNGKIVDITSDTQSLWKSDMKGVVLLIRAVNRNGTLGELGVYYL
jgi:pectinesterase